MGEFVRLETGDGIGTIRLERPPMNALNTQIQEELREAALNWIEYHIERRLATRTMLETT